MKLPKIRENLLAQDLSNEVLIYDTSTNKSYCLNETAKAVFNACDGKKTFADLNLPEDVIYLSLDELRKQNLIESDYVSPYSGINRREVIKKVGLASIVGFPVITSLVAPTAANAASGSNCPAGFTCVPANTMYCADSVPGIYNVSAFSSTDGTCSGTLVGSSTLACPDYDSGGFDICLSTIPNPPE